MLQAGGGVAADGRQPVRGFQRRRHVVHREPGREQLAGVDDDLDLARVATRHLDAADAGDPRQRRADDVEGVVVQVGDRQAARQVEAEDGEGGGVSRSTASSVSARQVLADLGDPVLHLLQRRRHVGRRLELRRDLGRAAEGPRAHAADAGHLHDRLLERPRHRGIIDRAGSVPLCAMTTMRGNWSGG